MVVLVCAVLEDGRLCCVAVSRIAQAHCEPSFSCAGALLCRALIETTPDHNVHTFISLAGPHGGQFGGGLAEQDDVGGGVGEGCQFMWNFSIEETIRTQLAVLYTVEPLYRGHHWDPAGCPV